MLEDIQSFINSSGVAITGTNLFVSTIPESLTLAVGLFDYAGEPPDAIAQTRAPGLQVLIRATSYSAGRAMADAIYEVLSPVGDEIDDESLYSTGVEINGTQYNRILPLEIPWYSGKTDTAQHEFVCNYRVYFYKE